MKSNEIYRCGTCGRFLGENAFHHQRHTCKKCVSNNNFLWAEMNKERKKLYNKKHYKENKEYYKKQHAEWNLNNKEWIKQYSERNKKYRKKYMKRWQMENKEYIKKCNIDRRNKWVEYIKSLGYICCIKCGYDKCFAALDFHHRDPKEKNKSIGNLIQLIFNKKNKQVVLTEIKKCDILCANCHRELHFIESIEFFEEEQND